MDQCAYVWRVTNNQLQDSCFRVTQNRNGGSGTYATATFAQGELWYPVDTGVTSITSVWQHNVFLLQAGSVAPGESPSDVTSIFGIDNSKPTTIYGDQSWDDGWKDDKVRVLVNYNCAIIQGTLWRGIDNAGSDQDQGDRLGN